MKTLERKAVMENLAEAETFISETLEQVECPMNAAINIDIAADEILSNIVNYAYSGMEPGDFQVLLDWETCPGTVIVTFSDQGVPYDPLEAPDPDTSLPLEERPTGGLGIFLVKKLMDSVEYRRSGDTNTLRITKKME